MADGELNPAAPPCLHFFSALLAMEPTDSLMALARDCGKGSVSERVQRFIWGHCINKAASTIYPSSIKDRKFHAPYLKNFLKKLISEAERNCSTVLDEIYEQYAYYMTSLKDEIMAGEIKRVNKYISFLFPEECFELSICSKSRKLLIPLQCSLNMLEGDTGCSIWPSCLYLSECILSFPELFSNKSCFEVGSGVGLVGICLAHVKASEVVLSDGDMSTLANMKLNLELNHLSVETDVQKTTEDPKKVKCFHLPWESVAGEQLQSFKPDIILGADVIYDPICLPHLVRLLTTLLNQTKSYSEKVNGNCQGSSLGSTCVYSNFNGANQEDDNDGNGDGLNFSPSLRSIKGPLALMASVIRNIDTFNCFLALIDKASLTITDVTETLQPINLLPYMQSYNRSSIRLFLVSSK